MCDGCILSCGDGICMKDIEGRGSRDDLLCGGRYGGNAMFVEMCKGMKRREVSGLCCGGDVWKRSIIVRDVL